MMTIESTKSSDSSDGLTASESLARAKAVRGLAKLKAGDHEQAREFLTSAAVLDPDIDFRRLPDFWTLSANAHETVVDALYDANLRQQAIRLVAELRIRFRPRIVGLR
jgi:hypothetical protein